MILPIRMAMSGTQVVGCQFGPRRVFREPLLALATTQVVAAVTVGSNISPLLALDQFTSSEKRPDAFIVAYIVT